MAALLHGGWATFFFLLLYNLFFPLSLTQMASKLAAECIFCKIIKGEIPSVKLTETANNFALLDIGPLSDGHALVIPKYHVEKMHQLPDEYLADALPVAKKIALALGVEDYNILQNNGKIAHQEVPHVHFHIIPKPNAKEGLYMSWPAKKANVEELKALASKLKL